MGTPWLALLALVLVGVRHPMHTAVAEVAQRDSRGHATIQLRVYADDLSASVAEVAGLSQIAGRPTPAADSAMARYLRGTFALADRTGRPVRLTWVGAERMGDVIVLRLEGEVAGGLQGARLTSLVLCERFEDQVNVVRAEYAGRTTTLLFTRGETATALP